MVHGKRPGTAAFTGIKRWCARTCPTSLEFASRPRVLHRQLPHSSTAGCFVNSESNLHGKPRAI
eukprot:1754086-Amphidinium_carterae.2